MKNWKLFAIEIFVLLISQVLDVQAACSWDSDIEQNYCTIRCTSDYSFSTGQETTDQVLANLEIKLRERTQCEDEGINLTMAEGMVYPDYMLKANWFGANVKVNELSINLNPISKVEVNAFEATAFKTLKKLILQTVKLDSFKKGIFNGLDSLEVLNLKDAALLKSVDKGVLDALNQTLKEFTLEQSSKYYSSISINGFTGSEQIPMLEYVKYLYNLGDTISNKSFVGLHNVKTLDLSECQITTIGPGTFDAISSSIEVLNLNNNLITKLPEGIFSLMLPSDTLNIFLAGHKWICDCDLMHFKLNLMENPNFVGIFQCNNSPIKGNDIIEADFCDFYVPPSPTTTIATTPTTTAKTTKASTAPPTKTSTATPTKTSTEPSTEASTEPHTEASTAAPIETTTETVDEFSQACFEQDETESSKTVAIKSPRSIFSINEDSKGDIIVQVNSPKENYVLIWFSSNDRDAYLSTHSEINCLNAERSISINNMIENTAYTFCLMDSTEKTVSPLDCISYTKPYDTREVPWLFDKSRSLVISMVVVACSFSVFAGLAIGVFAVRTTEFLKIRSNRNLSRINNAGITDVLKETFESNSMMREQSKKCNVFRDSYNTSRTTNTTVQYYLDSNIAPPLPARPTSIHPNGEPIYATVG